MVEITRSIHHSSLLITSFVIIPNFYHISGCQDNSLDLQILEKIRMGVHH